MMSLYGRFVSVILVFILSFTNIAAKSYTDGGDFLSRILSSKNGPVVVLLDSDQLSTRQQTNDPNDESSVEEAFYVPAPGEQDAYLLYTVLKSAQQEESLDSKAARIFEKSKSVLRTAFRQRCAKRQSCENKCPPKKNEGCQANCQKVFDELDACDQEPACKKSTGCEQQGPKTKPPKWLRSLIIARQGSQ